MVSIVVSYRAAVGRAHDVASLLAGYVPLVRAEPGCVLFEAGRSRSEPGTFHLYEVYESDDALEAHKAAPHYAVFLDRVSPLLVDCSVAVAERLGS